jgi:tetratricopeptide (TPR) repeat protein
MGGSLLYPKSFVIDPEGVIIWSGETVDLGEMLQDYFAGTFDRKAAEKTAPMLEELQTLLRESSEPRMRALVNKIFELSPAHPGALRIRLFSLENSGRIPQAWELLEERLKAAPGTGRLYFTAIDFISRYAYFRPRLGGVLKNFAARIRDPQLRCAMAWELLQRFQYDLTALEYACRLLGETPPADAGLGRLWYAAKARTAYLTGDLSGAVRFQKSASRSGQGKDPMLEYFEGAAKLGTKRP